MDVSKIDLIYFSPTNSTKRVLELLAGVWKKDAVHWDMTDYAYAEKSGEFAAGDLVYMGVPSYGGRVPALAAKRLGQMRGQKTPAVLAVTYGNRDYEDTLLELSDIARRQGFVPTAAVAAVTEHSILRQYASGRPDEEDKEELRHFGEAIRDRIWSQSQEEAPSLPVKGNHPYRGYSEVPLKPYTGKKCTGCGLCAKKCPAGAISPEDPRQTDKTKCISCMRCVRICSNHARIVNKVMLAAAGLKLKKECTVRKDNELVLPVSENIN